MSETTSDISEWEFGVAPLSTKQYGSNTPYASFGAGATGRAMARAHADALSGDRVVRRHAHSSEWIEDAAGEES